MGVFSDFMRIRRMYDNINYEETQREIAYFIRVANETTNENGEGKVYWKKDIHNALKAVMTDCNKTSIKKLIRTYPQMIIYVKYK